MVCTDFSYRLQCLLVYGYMYECVINMHRNIRPLEYIVSLDNNDSFIGRLPSLVERQTVFLDLLMISFFTHVRVCKVQCK